MKINTPVLIAIVVVILLGLFFLFKPKTETTKQVNTTLPVQQNTQQVVSATKTVAMKEDIFEPEILTVQKGTRVIFKNQDSVERWPASNLHPTHTIYSEFDPKQPVVVGQEWSFIFEKVGNWKYHDHLLPAVRGKIRVVETLDEVNKMEQNTFQLVIQNKKIVSGPTTIKVNQGEDVAIKITSDEVEEFHVHAYDNSVDLEPGRQVALTFNANLSGRFPFELENSKTEIGVLEVSPK